MPLCDFPNCWNETQTCVETEDGTKIYYCQEHNAETTVAYVLDTLDKLNPDKDKE